jgi:hypothetical protein
MVINAPRWDNRLFKDSYRVSKMNYVKINYEMEQKCIQFLYEGVPSYIFII